MAQSLPVVDLYSATGITVGTKIIIQKISGSNVRLVESVSQPSLNGGYNLLVDNLYSTSADIPIGAWAYAQSGTTLQIEEVES
jgi:hypothetical protein